jgi:transcriptional regulator with XRE-family HTH domain
MKDQPTVLDQLRDEILARTKKGQTQYEIAKATGIDRAFLSRFLRRESSLGMRSFIALCRALNLQISPIQRRSRKSVA